MDVEVWILYEPSATGIARFLREAGFDIEVESRSLRRAARLTGAWRRLPDDMLVLINVRLRRLPAAKLAVHGNGLHCNTVDAELALDQSLPRCPVFCTEFRL